MFCWFFKKNKQPKQKNKKTVSKYVPCFGDGVDFAEKYKEGNEHLIIGSLNGNPIGLTTVNPPADSIVMINDNPKSVLEQCVAPILTQAKLSYVVYDPTGEYQNALAAKMRSKLYDVQVLDLSDSNHRSRVDLFEVVNITGNPYWTSVILAGSIKCEQHEVSVAHNLFSAMMEYLLSTEETVKIDSMCKLFNLIVKNDAETFDNLRNCKASQKAFEIVASADEKVRMSVCKKAYVFFFKEMAPKLQNPNIFSVTSHRRQTITFVKKVPDIYKNLVTAFLFNMKVSSVVCGDGDASVVILDTAIESWYNRPLLKKVTEEAGSVMDKSVSVVKIRSALEVVDISKNQIMIYMKSDNEETRKFVYELLKTKNQLTGDEKKAAADRLYHGKSDLTQEDLDTCPIAFDALTDLQNQIVIDMTRQTKSFICDRLN